MDQCHHDIDKLLQQSGVDNELSTYSSKEWAHISNIINKSTSSQCVSCVGIDQRYYNSCVIVSIMSVSVPSDKDKDRLMQAFHNMVKDSSDKKLEEWIPEHYWELEKYVFHNCLLTSLMRKVPFCLRCSSFVKSDSFFCPNCRKENALCPLYRDCKTRKCIHEERVKEDIRNFCAKKEVVKDVKELSCGHCAKAPFAYCAYYIPVVAVILEMVRSRMWCSIPFTSNSDYLQVCEELVMDNLSALSSGNSIDIQKRWGNYVVAYSMERSLYGTEDPSTVTLLEELTETREKNSRTLEKFNARTPQPPDTTLKDLPSRVNEGKELSMLMPSSQKALSTSFVSPSSVGTIIVKSVQSNGVASTFNMPPNAPASSKRQCIKPLLFASPVPVSAPLQSSLPPLPSSAPVSFPLQTSLPPLPSPAPVSVPLRTALPPLPCPDPFGCASQEVTTLQEMMPLPELVPPPDPFPFRIPFKPSHKQKREAASPSDPDYIWTDDPLDRYICLDEESLQLSQQKVIRDFSLVAGSNTAQLAKYIKQLQIIQCAKSKLFPPSFVVNLKYMMAGLKSLDTVRIVKKSLDSYLSVKSLACILRDVSQELSDKHGCLPSDSFCLFKDNLPAVNVAFSDQDVTRVKELYSVLESSQALFDYMNCLCDLLTLVCGWFSKEYERVTCSEDNGQLVRSTIIPPSQMKMGRELEERITTARSFFCMVFTGLCELCKRLGAWFCDVVRTPSTNVASYHAYVSLVRDLMVGTVVDAYGLLKDPNESMGVLEMDLGVLKAVWNKCAEQCLVNSRGKLNPVKSFFFPQRCDKSYKKSSGGGLQRLADVSRTISAFKGVTSIEDHYLLFRVSGDGTLATKNSTNSNSWYCFSLSLVNLPPVLETMGRDVFALFILPENGPSLLQVSSRESRKGLSKAYVEYAQEMTASHRRAVDWRIQEYALGGRGRKAILLDLVKDLRCINAKYLSKPRSFVVSDKKQEAKSGSRNSPYWLIVDDEKKYQKAVTFSNGQTRQLINILLHETRVEGDRGILVPFGDKALHIRFAVINAKADLKACDEMADSSGLSSSNKPCRMCGIAYNRLDINTGLSSLQLSANLHSLRDKMKGLHSGLIQEPMDSSLRFINYIACLLYRMKQGYPVKDSVDAFLQEAKRVTGLAVKPETVEELRSLEKFLRVLGVSLPPYKSESFFFPQYEDDRECKPPTCPPFSNGCVHLSDNLGFPVCRCICPDLMHLVPNAMKAFFSLLFGENAFLGNAAQSKQYVAAVETSFANVDFDLRGTTDRPLLWCLPPSVLSHALDTMTAMKLNATNCFLKAFTDKTTGNLSTHDYHVLVFCYLPLLLLRDVSVPQVRCIISIMCVCQKLYNCRHGLSTVRLLAKKLSVLIQEYDTYMHPSAESPSFHYMLHMGPSILWFGPLRPNDCFPEEGSFFPMKQLILATPNPSVTVFLKKVKQAAMYMVVVDDKGTITVGDKKMNRGVILMVKEAISYKEIQLRTLFNYEADKDWLYFGCFNQRTLWEAEKCGCLSAVVDMDSSDSSVKKTVMKSLSRENLYDGNGGYKTMSSYEMIEKTAQLCDITLLKSNEYGMEGYVSSCTCNGTQFTAIPYSLRELTSTNMQKNPNAFALVTDYFDTVHLYALCGFFQSRIRDEYYHQVWAYEVPVSSASCDEDTSSCFYVDFSSDKMKRDPYIELLSIRRCIGGLTVFPASPDVIGVLTEKTGLKQVIHVIQIPKVYS